MHLWKRNSPERAEELFEKKLNKTPRARYEIYRKLAEMKQKQFKYKTKKESPGLSSLHQLLPELPLLWLFSLVYLIHIISNGKQGGGNGWVNIIDRCLYIHTYHISPKPSRGIATRKYNIYVKPYGLPAAAAIYGTVPFLQIEVISINGTANSSRKAIRAQCAVNISSDEPSLQFCRLYNLVFESNPGLYHCQKVFLRSLPVTLSSSTSACMLLILPKRRLLFHLYFPCFIFLSQDEYYDSISPKNFSY